MAVLSRSSTASEPLRLLLLAVLACAAAGASVCDMVNCGMGNCTELPELILPGSGLHAYECHCFPGWSRALATPLTPCIVPKCSFDSRCLNLSMSPPTGIPRLDVCGVVSCGAGGACKPGSGAAFLSYTCECQPGYDNMLNLTTLPCDKNCFFGQGCSALGLAPPAPSPVPQPSPSPTPPPAPTVNHDSSGPSAPPSGTQGSAASWRLLQLLLLVTLAMAHVL